MKSDTTSSPQVNKTVEKLAKICGMLGFLHDGEEALASVISKKYALEI